MNTEKAERLRAIADWIAKKGSPDFPTPTITNYIGFLLSLADEESKPLELDADKAEGLSLRDHFAANAINGMIAGYDPQSKANGRFVPENDYPLLAEQSYQIADAMLNERTKKQSPLELSDLERFGVALLDWYFRDLKRENISTAVEHNTLKFFL